jgi:hypothetical protein
MDQPDGNSFRNQFQKAALGKKDNSSGSHLFTG